MVKDGEDHNRIGFNGIMDGIGESAKEGPANTGANWTKALRGRRDTGKDFIYSRGEFGAQAGLVCDHTRRRLRVAPHERWPRMIGKLIHVYRISREAQL